MNINIWHLGYARRHASTVRLTHWFNEICYCKIRDLCNVNQINELKRFQRI